VLHSRCFFDPGSQRHLAVPGVDMCNHSFTPNASVRVLNSPAACQGLAALQDVAPAASAAAAAAACSSYFQLVVGERGATMHAEMRRVVVMGVRGCPAVDASALLAACP
jgi:hypothetical protein